MRQAHGEGDHPQGGGGVDGGAETLPLHHASPFDAACGGAQDRHGPPPRASRREELVQRPAAAEH
jgi:hypothetical protein